VCKLTTKTNDLEEPATPPENVLAHHQTKDPVANCASSSPPINKGWLVDSAASKSVTSDLSNLSLNYEYERA